MDVDDATAYTEKLLAMTDEQYSEYMALWEQKQKAAADVAQRFYSDEMTSLVNEYVSKVPDALGIIKVDLVPGRSAGGEGTGARHSQHEVRRGIRSESRCRSRPRRPTLGRGYPLSGKEVGGSR